MGINSEKSSTKSAKIRKRGNDLFLKNNRENYRMVLSLYTKSIAYAPLKSEELALAYGNRSALWLHMHKYDLCLIDLGRALDITKSNSLAQKLSSRRDKCWNHLSSAVPKGQKPSKSPIRITPSKSSLCGADCIMVKHDKKYGRHYVATRNITPGEIVMCEKTPYTSVDIGQMYLVCAHCLAFAWAGIPCDFCIFTVYCSETCKIEAWSQYHDILCELYSMDCISDRLLYNEQQYGLQLLGGLSSDVFMILIRMLIIFIKKDGLESLMEAAGKNLDGNVDSYDAQHLAITTNCTSLQYVCSLMANTEEDIDVNIIPILKWVFRNSTKVSFESYDSKALASLKILAEKLDAKILMNAFQFSAIDCCCKDSEFSDCVSGRGTVFAPCSSLFNHACDNNVDRLFLSGPRVIFIANRPINKEDQLFVCYGPNASVEKRTRHMMLQNNYPFTCDCIACIEDWPTNYDADRDK
ncbi:hypothetical protein QAD02_015602, partial [Eretmocerus hayati]